MRYLDDDGDIFDVSPFEDGQVAKYAHADCAYSAEVKPHELRPGWCILDDHQFYPNESAIKADTGVLIEHGKVPIPVFHVEAEGGCVHWACAWDYWDWDLFRGFLRDGSKQSRR